MSSSSGPPLAHRSVASIRPTLSNSAGPDSPQTPSRTISSTFGSPSALRAEEECIVLEIGARYLRAGFAGDAEPKAVIDYGPEEQRRAGDYRRWEVDYAKTRTSEILGKSWGEQYELFTPDLRCLDLGLVGDKIDRAIREAFTKYMLIDSRPRKTVLALPSTIPHPLLSAILDTLFKNFQPPNISLMSAPVLTTVAAGLRSALVVDIGWAETTVTAVYEYREVQCRRSVRGTKMLGEATFRLLVEKLELGELLDGAKKPADDSKLKLLPTFEECEEVMTRVGWCKPSTAAPKADTLSQGLTPVKEEDEFRTSIRTSNIAHAEDSDRIVTVDLGSTQPRRILKVPFSDLANPCETALLGTGRALQDIDDEELPIQMLIYRSLLQLPTDTRSICMSRIIFVGGGSQLPGLRERLLTEVANLVDRKGWNPVEGKIIDQAQSEPNFQGTKHRPIGPVEVQPSDGLSRQGTSAAHVKQEDDPIEDQLRYEASKGSKPVVAGRLRVVESLGAWAGGSLLSQLKIPTVSVLDREQWLQQGISGASRSGNSTVSTRQSMAPGGFKSAGGDRSSWTLGLWG